jgi:hypothetical protein
MPLYSIGKRIFVVQERDHAVLNSTFLLLFFRIQLYAASFDFLCKHKIQPQSQKLQICLDPNKLSILSSGHLTLNHQLLATDTVQVIPHFVRYRLAISQISRLLHQDSSLINLLKLLLP